MASCISAGKEMRSEPTRRNIPLAAGTRLRMCCWENTLAIAMMGVMAWLKRVKWIDQYLEYSSGISYNSCMWGLFRISKFEGLPALVALQPCSKGCYDTYHTFLYDCGCRNLVYSWLQVMGGTTELISNGHSFDNVAVVSTTAGSKSIYNLSPHSPIRSLPILHPLTSKIHHPLSARIVSSRILPSAHASSRAKDRVLRDRLP